MKMKKRRGVDYDVKYPNLAVMALGNMRSPQRGRLETRVYALDL
jgi:hypothetical protein